MATGEASSAATPARSSLDWNEDLRRAARRGLRGCSAGTKPPWQRRLGTLLRCMLWLLQVGVWAGMRRPATLQGVARPQQFSTNPAMLVLNC